jgi:hypothetical protein
MTVTCVALLSGSCQFFEQLIAEESESQRQGVGIANLE